MADGEINSAVRIFIHQHINSVEQLEVLLLMLKRSEKEWSSAEVSRELYIQKASAATRLADLQGSGLLSCTEGSSPKYKYSPADTNLDKIAREVATAYEVRRVAVINLILERPLDNVRVFSDAFRLRRDD